MKKMLQIIFVFILVLAFSSVNAKEGNTSAPSSETPAQAAAGRDKKEAPKCEKCYRGPDGKIKCDPVPCPQKK